MYVKKEVKINIIRIFLFFIIYGIYKEKIFFQTIIDNIWKSLKESEIFKLSFFETIFVPLLFAPIHLVVGLLDQ
jgi:hypothetical protein